MAMYPSQLGHNLLLGEGVIIIGADVTLLNSRQ